MPSLTAKVAARIRDDRYYGYLNSFKEPLPYNVLRGERIKRNLTIQALADNCGLSKQTIIRAEQGLFDEPPVKLVEWLVRNGSNELEITNAYHNFQLLTRSRHNRIFGDFALNSETHTTTKEHPLNWLLGQWVAPGDEPMNITELAKLLCLSQPLLSSWVKNPKQVKVPAPLLTALFQNGYAKWELQVFVEMYNVYRKAALTK